MPYLIKSKLIDPKDINKDESTSIGNFYSGDRFYTILNEYIDANLTRKSRTLAFIIKFLFKSSNYKHDSSIANGRSIWITLLDVFCVLCLIGFFAMIISVIGVSAAGISAVLQEAGNSGIGGIAAFGQSFINSLSANIPMLVFAVIFLVIGIAWLIMFFKIRKKNYPLSLKDYVTKKINFILKWRFLIKATSKATSTVIKKKDIKVYELDMFEQQGGSTDRWLNLQTINLLSSIFVDFNLVFKFQVLSDEEYAEMKKFIDYDFKRIEILKLKK